MLRNRGKKLQPAEELVRNAVVLDKTPKTKGAQAKGAQTNAQGADQSNLGTDQSYLGIDPLEPLLEPLPGSVVAQLTQCGRSNCRCQVGQKHGPYFYRVWREGDTVKKAYVKKQDVDRVRQQCKDYPFFFKQLQVLQAEGKRLRAQITAHCDYLQAGCK